MTTRARPTWSGWRRHAARLHAAALEAADPARAVERTLRWDGRVLRAGAARWTAGPERRIRLIALGKASIGMTRGALRVLAPRARTRPGPDLDGVVVHPEGARPGTGWPRGLRFVAGAHPIPAAASLRAGRAIARCAERARPGDLLLVLLSGGGSAMAELPQPGVGLREIGRITRALQRAGVDIEALNTVRRALSQLKGGKLARRAGGATVVTLALSDVVGDPPAAIASGPTVPSPTGPRDALRILEAHGLAAKHPGVAAALRGAPRPSAGSGRRDRKDPGARPGYVVVGSNAQSARAAADEARRLGFETRRLARPVVGEAREAGARIGAAAVRAAARARHPTCLVAGGETTVTVRGGGTGGRTLEVALGAARVLRGAPRVALFAFATDGWDGSSRAAGAYATGATWSRARRLGADPERVLQDHDTAPLFRALGDLLVTGRSGTNVNDLTIALIYPPSPTPRGTRRSPPRIPRDRFRA